MRDPYEVLGVDKTATNEEIKKAFRKAAMAVHPDKNPGNKDMEAKFKEINAAWQLLSDPQKRAAFDRMRGPSHDEFLNETFRREARSHVWSVWHEDLEDLSKVVPGEDMEASITITLEEAVAGRHVEVRALSNRPVVPCAACGGLGAARGTITFDCSSCGGGGKTHGTGRVRDCPACGGLGKKHVVPCHNCGGRGRVPFLREVKVNVPSGVDTGDRLRLAGQGVPGKNSSPGDMYVTVFVQEHPRFKRQKKNLIFCATLDALEIMYGTAVPVQRLDGTFFEVPIPPGFCTGVPIVVRGEGVQTVTEGEKGNLHLMVQIRVPEARSPKSRTLLEDLIKELGAGK